MKKKLSKRGKATIAVIVISIVSATVITVAHKYVSLHQQLNAEREANETLTFEIAGLLDEVEFLLGENDSLKTELKELKK